MEGLIFELLVKQRMEKPNVIRSRTMAPEKLGYAGAGLEFVDILNNK